MAKKIVLIPEPYDTWYTLEEARVAMGFKHSQYVRSLARNGKLGEYGIGVIKADMGAFQQWLINPEACEAYKARTAASGGFGNRTGIRRFILRVNASKITEAQIADSLFVSFGEPGTEDAEDFNYQFGPAWTGQKSPKAKAKAADEPPEVFTARIIASLTTPDDGLGLGQTILEDLADLEEMPVKVADPDPDPDDDVLA